MLTKDKNISKIYSSPYKRAIDTVKQLSDFLHLDIELVEDFRERKISSEWIEDFNDFSEKQWLKYPRPYVTRLHTLFQIVQNILLTDLPAPLTEASGASGICSPPSPAPETVGVECPSNKSLSCFSRSVYI